MDVVYVIAYSTPFLSDYVSISMSQPVKKVKRSDAFVTDVRRARKRQMLSSSSGEELSFCKMMSIQTTCTVSEKLRPINYYRKPLGLIL